jgi:hypothetical protein
MHCIQLWICIKLQRSPQMLQQFLSLKIVLTAKFLAYRSYSLVEGIRITWTFMGFISLQQYPYHHYVHHNICSFSTILQLILRLCLKIV